MTDEITRYTNGSITIGQFYNSLDKKHHFAEYIPYSTQPKEYLCEGIGNFSPSASTDENRNICEGCSDRLLEIMHK